MAHKSHNCPIIALLSHYPVNETILRLGFIVGFCLDHKLHIEFLAVFGCLLRLGYDYVTIVTITLIYCKIPYRFSFLSNKYYVQKYPIL
jgi:hypothetical protein